MGMALCSLVRLSQISGAPSHRRSTWCRHQPADGKAHLAYILCVSAVQTTVAVKGTFTVPLLSFPPWIVQHCRKSGSVHLDILSCYRFYLSWKEWFPDTEHWFGYSLHLQGWVHAKPIEMQRFEQFTALIIINFHITTWESIHDELRKSTSRSSAFGSAFMLSEMKTAQILKPMCCQIILNVLSTASSHTYCTPLFYFGATLYICSTCDSLFQ